MRAALLLCITACGATAACGLIFPVEVASDSDAGLGSRDGASGDGTSMDQSSGDGALGDSAPGDSATGDAGQGDAATTDTSVGDTATGDSSQVDTGTQDSGTPVDLGVRCGDASCAAPMPCCMYGLPPYQFACQLDGCREAGGVTIGCDDSADCPLKGQSCCLTPTFSIYGPLCLNQKDAATGCTADDLKMCNPALNGTDCPEGGPCGLYENWLPGYYTCAAH